MSSHPPPPLPLLLSALCLLRRSLPLLPHTPSAEVLAEDRRRSVATAAALRAHAARLHLPAAVVTRPGDPRSVVSEYVEKNGTDLLVVGSRGLSGLGKLLLGSVSSYLVAHVGCSVVVYRPAKEDDA